MTIKEMEVKTSLSRANIRYYESEGLINPQRRENGYRVYSEEDAGILLKVKLLRSLDISLEEIKALRTGDQQLPAALNRHLETLSQKQNQLARTQEVTRQMISAEEAFDTLNAALYLHALEEGTAQVLKKDVSQRLNLPWRRYWARCLDFELCYMLIYLLLQDFEIQGSYLSAMSFAAMLLLEPLMLRLFATTPGKVIFGIRVTAPEGGRLGYWVAMERTWLVLLEGEGLRMPLISEYFHYKSLIKAENDEPLPWENDSELTIKDDNLWRYGIYFAIEVALNAFLIIQILQEGGLF